MYEDVLHMYIHTYVYRDIEYVLVNVISSKFTVIL